MMIHFVQQASSAVMFAVMVMTNPTPVQIEQVSVPTESTIIVAESSTPPSVQDVLLSVCEARGYGEDCAKTLLGMLWVESNNVSTAIGDSGLARGYFQIHYDLHNITIECAENLTCSANWTLDYMKSHGYPEQTTHAVQCHNTCYANNGYAARAARASANMWETPLLISEPKRQQIATI